METSYLRLHVELRFPESDLPWVVTAYATAQSQDLVMAATR
jgi:hypothetical protein